MYIGQGFWEEWTLFLIAMSYLELSLLGFVEGVCNGGHQLDDLTDEVVSLLCICFWHAFRGNGTTLVGLFEGEWG